MTQQQIKTDVAKTPLKNDRGVIAPDSVQAYQIALTVAGRTYTSAWFTGDDRAIADVLRGIDRASGMDVEVIKK